MDLGNDATLTCRVNGNPTPAIIWMKKGVCGCVCVCVCVCGGGCGLVWGERLFLCVRVVYTTQGSFHESMQRMTFVCVCVCVRTFAVVKRVCKCQRGVCVSVCTGICAVNCPLQTQILSALCYNSLKNFHVTSECMCACYA